MASSKYSICVATTNPSSSMTPSGGGGSLTMMCPQTGSINSSLRTTADMSGKAALGMSSVSLFPKNFFANSNNNSNNLLAVAYGKNVSKSADSYAMLLTLRTASSPPILHWKCRLPEANLTAGLSVSRCGYYIAGGGSSGTCFIWSSLGGKLLKIFKAHYRSCTSLVWSDCGRYLLTGGADGMVHVYSLMDLVDRTSLNSNNGSNKLQQQQQEQTVPPFHTWSVHHLPVTCLAHLDSGRVASSSEDGQVVVFEIFSRTVVATIQLPHGIRCLDHRDGRLFAGSTNGDIYTIDLNSYAMRKTSNQGATSTKRRRLLQQKDNVTLEDSIFGKDGLSSSDPLSSSSAAAGTGDASYHTALKGHDRPVTALALLVEDDLQERLISGDESGTIRIWDMASRTCLRVVQPWSHSAFNNAVTTKAKTGDGTTSSSSQQRHPVTSIGIILQDSESLISGGGGGGSGGMLSHSHSSGNSESVLSLMTPLQRFTSNSDNEDQDNSIPIPFLKPQGTLEAIDYWGVDASYAETYHRKPFVFSDAEVSNNEDTDADKAKLEKSLEEQRKKIEHLQKELAERTSQVQRWENVNNKLVAKLDAARK